MPNLDGSSRPIELAPGYRMTAPGLVGTADTQPARAPGTRSGGPERATADLDEALRRSGVNDVLTIVLDVRGVPSPLRGTGARTPQGEDAVVLEVPDLGDTVGQVVLAVDEEGVATWNFPLDLRGGLQTPGVRGIGGSKRFAIRGYVPASAAPESRQRGLIQLVGKKVLKVLVYPVTDAVLGPVSEHFAQKWEQRYRPYLVRRFGPDDYRRDSTPALNAADWKTLAEGRSLLFLHGTFSTSRAGFAGLPPATLSALYQTYKGRVFAFDHFTLSEGPEKNAAEFLNLIPIDVRLDLDVVCHSRGGLLARVLSEDSPRGKERRIRIRRTVFVGTPNHGTALADPDHLVTMIDRYTSILNLAPPGPLSTVTEVLEGVITAVKVIGHAAVNGLDGISAMNPRGAFLRKLNARAPASETEYYGIAANFEPGGSLKQYVKQAVADRILDRIFDDEENDLIVPTTGVYKGGQLPGFPIPDSRVLRFEPGDSVAHTQYFARAETSTRLLQWLSAG